MNIAKTQSTKIDKKHVIIYISITIIVILLDILNYTQINEQIELLVLYILSNGIFLLAIINSLLLVKKIFLKFYNVTRKLYTKSIENDIWGIQTVSIKKAYNTVLPVLVILIFIAFILQLIIFLT